MMFNTKFKTVAIEYGMGTQAISEFPLRVEMENFQAKRFSGIGFGLDALLARLASEGEALERATWRYGALWNSAVLSYKSPFLPDEVKVLFTKKEQEEMHSLPSVAYKAWSSEGEALMIPSVLLFFYPKRKQFGEQHAVTTGWAFHSSKSEALAQAYREVIERDLQMLFWHDRLGDYLSCVSSSRKNKWLSSYGGKVESRAKIYLLEMPLKLHSSIHTDAWFSLVFIVNDEAPYLSIGSAVKASAHKAFETAMGEMMMLRSYQYEMILTGEKNSDEFNYKSHVTKATYEKKSQTRVKKLIANLKGNKENILDYSEHAYQVVYLDPPPQTREGVVAKVWVDRTQGMVPAGFQYKVCEHWQTFWQVSQASWEANAWHPYP